MALKKCPFCAEEIQEDAVFCKHCKSDLSGAPIPPRPESSAAATGTPPVPGDTRTSAEIDGKADRRGAEFVMGLLGGIFGIVAALSGLMFSGVGAAIGMKGAETIGNLTVAAMLFSVWGIVGAAVVRRHGKLGGLFMTAAAVGGIVSISLFFVLPGVLLGIAGIMGLAKKNQVGVTTKFAIWAPVTVAIFAASFAIGMASKPTAGVGKDNIDTSKANKAGEDVAVGELAYNVSAARWSDGIKGEITSYTGSFLIVDFAVANLGKEEATIDTSMFTLVDNKGTEYKADQDATGAIKGDPYFLMSTHLNPNMKIVGSVAFNLSKQEKFPKLKVTGGTMSSDAKLIELEAQTQTAAPQPTPPAAAPMTAVPNTGTTASSQDKKESDSAIKLIADKYYKGSEKNLYWEKIGPEAIEVREKEDLGSGNLTTSEAYLIVKGQVIAREFDEKSTVDAYNDTVSKYRSGTVVDNTKDAGTANGRWAWTTQRIATDNELSQLSSDDLELMRNEIYARHGWVFKRKNLQDYFTKQSWYKAKGTTANRDSVNGQIAKGLSAIEKRNIDLISKAEKNSSVGD